VIELEGVQFRYDGMQMQFDLVVPTASFSAVLGPSGAGKSTLLSLIAGFDIPTAGVIRIAGMDQRDIPPDRRPVSMIFQDNNLFGHLSLWQNVAIGLSPGLKVEKNEKRRIDEALAEVGLSDLARRLPAQVSGGERQRAAIARALVRDRPVLLLDEPFAALGPGLRRDMLGLVKRLQMEHAVTVLMVSHQPEDAAHAASHTALVVAGRVVAMEPTATLLARRDIADLVTYLGDWRTTG
jgi:thiamine transport system ATP-binding protein